MTTKTSTQSQAPKDNRKPAAFSASRKKPKTPKTPKSTAKSQSGQNHNPKGDSNRLPVVATTIKAGKLKNNRGRGNPYDKAETMKKICDIITLGGNLNRICCLPDYPDEITIKKWLRSDDKLATEYARAREARADARSDRIDMITADVRSGALDASAARVMIDAEKWQAGHEMPGRYGDRVELEHGGKVGLDIKVIPIKFLEPDPMLPEK